MKQLATGVLQKMLVSYGKPASYRLPVGDQQLDISDLIGRQVSIEWHGKIHCSHCHKPTKKSFNQGYCYSCFSKLAQCDQCMMNPVTCHYAEGTCREPEWGERICFDDHIVYLANSSGVKVGITRMKNMPGRWFDQGAVQALPIFRTASRYLAGVIEDTLRSSIADKTNWRAMLKGTATDVDLVAVRDQLVNSFASELDAIRQQHGELSITLLNDEQVRDLTYPVEVFPTKVVSQSLDKTPQISGKLMGIKGQYLMFDSGVFNVRKFTSYEVTVAANLDELDSNVNRDLFA